MSQLAVVGFDLRDPRRELSEARLEILDLRVALAEPVSKLLGLGGEPDHCVGPRPPLDALLRRLAVTHGCRPAVAPRRRASSDRRLPPTPRRAPCRTRRAGGLPSPRSSAAWPRPSAAAPAGLWSTIRALPALPPARSSAS